MLIVLMALINVGKVRFAAFRAWFWLALTGGFLFGGWGCFPVMVYGPGPDYDEGPGCCQDVQPVYGPPDICLSDADSGDLENCLK